MQIQELAGKISAEVYVPEACKMKTPEIKAVASLEHASQQDISFYINPLYEKSALATNAGAIIVKQPLVGCSVVQLLHPNPYWAFAKVSQLFHDPDLGPVGVSPGAEIDPSATIGKNARIYPRVFIGKNAVIGDDVTLYPGVFVGHGSKIDSGTTVHGNTYIYHHTQIGKNCIIHAGVVIGSDGFGFAPQPPSTHSAGEIAKIPQVGIVVIEDEVEIGSNCSIDRAALGETRIGKSCKLDSQVHVGHNVKIGHHTMISGQSEIAGSCTYVPQRHADDVQ